MRMKHDCTRHGARIFALIGIAALVMAQSAQLSGQERSVLVETAKAETQPVIRVVEVSGTVVSPKRSRVSVAVGGLVETLSVDLGDHVAEGDLLLELDKAQANYEVEQALAAMNEAKAQLQENQRLLRIAEKLREQNTIPENQIDERRAAIAVTRAVLARLKAEAEIARVQFDRHVVLAPFSGVVSHAETEKGEWVSPGMTVVELVASDALEIELPVPQIYFPNLRNGAPITVRFDAAPGQSYETEQVALVPVSDPTDRTFRLRVRTVNSDIPLTPGMSARASIRLDSGVEGVVVSRDAIIRYPDGRTTVWTVERKDNETRAVEQNVTLGTQFDGLVHIVDGLDAGADVVVRGNESLQPNQQVRMTGTTG